MKIGPVSSFDPELLSFWMIMKVTGIARGGSPCVLAPTSRPLRRGCCGSGAPMKVVGDEGMKCVLLEKDLNN